MLKEICRTDIPGAGIVGKKKDNQTEADIKAFIESDMDAAEVTGIKRYKTPNSAYSAYLTKAKMLGVWPKVRPILRGARVFIVREGGDDA